MNWMFVFVFQSGTEAQGELQKEGEGTARHSQRPPAGEGATTLYRLMTSQRRRAQRNNTDLVYLHIGTLNPTEIFVSDSSFG